ncbi:MAG: LysM domain-containing protein [Patescibacteria group bacterium]|jgi:LysM repeat protein
MELVPVIVTMVALLVLAALATAVAKAFSKNNTVGGIVGFAVFLASILLMGMGEIKTPLTDWTTNLVAVVSHAAATAPSTAPVSVRRMPDPSPTPSQQDNPGTTAVPETPAEPTTATDRSEMFDLGSGVVGYFDDDTPYTEYIVQPGDNLYRIGQNFGIDDIEIANRNGLHIGRYQIYPGDVLKIPK